MRLEGKIETIYIGFGKFTQTPQNPPPIQFFSSPKLGGFCIMKKTKPLKALPSPPNAFHSFHFFLPFIPSPPFPYKLPNRALV